ncbi:MAG TPA: hypothetical protein VF885_22720 [Arthrobacter sp.]
MSDPIRAHVQAVLDRLEADPAFAGKVIDTNEPKTADQREPPYLVVYSDTGKVVNERATAELPHRLDFQYTIHAVGADANQARAWAGKVFMLLAGWKPVVDGWRPQGMTKRRQPLPLQFDKSYTPELVYSVDIFDQTTRKA